MLVLNDPSPWWHGLDGSLSIVDLLARDTIPAESSALLWWTLEQGASLLTAGGPSGAGKTTLANAALSFLPDAARVYVMSGADDPLAVPRANGPSVLLVTEFSAHGRPTYVAGPSARRAFALLATGWTIVGTLHADNVAEAVDALYGEVGLGVGDITQPAVVAIIRVMNHSAQRGRVPRGESDLERRVVEIGLLVPARTGVRPVALATWNAASGRLERAVPPAGVAALAAWTGLPAEKVEAAIADRAAVLADLLQHGRHGHDDVATSVRQFWEHTSR